MSSNDHKQPSVSVQASLTRGGHVLRVDMKEPPIAHFPGGHPFLRLQSDEFPHALQSLRSKMLPPDQSPFVDNKEGQIREMAKDMKAAGGEAGDFAEQAKWLIDVLLPRVEATPLGPNPLPIPEPRNFKDLRLMLNRSPEAAREDELVTAASLMSQDKVLIKVNEYLPIFYQEEPHLIGVTAMRICHESTLRSVEKCGNADVYMCVIEGNPTNTNEDPMRVGLAVFPDDHTMLTFTNDRTHPSVTSIYVLSDPTVLATQWIRRADQVMRRANYIFPYALADGCVDEGSIDATIKLIKERAAMASYICPEHAELEGFFAAVESVRKDQKSRFFANRFEALHNGLTELIAGQNASQQEVYDHVIGLIDFVADAYWRAGGQEAVHACSMQLSQLIGALPAWGFSHQLLPGLLLHRQQKLDMRIPEVEMKLMAADAAQWTDITSGIYFDQLKLELDKLDKKLLAKSIEPEDAVEHVKSIADKFGEGMSRFGTEHESMKSGLASLTGFVTLTLPRHGLHPHMLSELVAYIDPATLLADTYRKDIQSELSQLDIELKRKSKPAPDQESVNGPGATVIQLRPKLAEPKPEEHKSAKRTLDDKSAEEIRGYVKILISKLEEGEIKCGAMHQHIRSARASIMEFVTKTLPEYDVPAEAVAELAAYLDPDSAERSAMHVRDAFAAVLHCFATGTEVDVAVERTKQVINLMVEFTKTFGYAHQDIPTMNTWVENLVDGIFPKHGVPQERINEIILYYDEKFLAPQYRNPS